MIILCLALTACSGGRGQEIEQMALNIKNEFLKMETCQGSAELVADYGQRVYNYTVDFHWAREGELVLELLAPEEVAGMTARVAEGQSTLEYDGIRLETGPLDREGFSPMDAIPALLRALETDFMAECGLSVTEEGEEVLRLCFRPPEAAPGMGRELMLWISPETHALLRGEVAQDGITVIQCVFTKFTPG